MANLLAAAGKAMWMTSGGCLTPIVASGQLGEPALPTALVFNDLVVNLVAKLTAEEKEVAFLDVSG
jgi:hypothetical protein